jgi:hypothetical protein
MNELRMRCLTSAEFERWLEGAGIRILKDRDLSPLVDGSGDRFDVKLPFPGEPVRLPEFCRRLINWLPNGGERLLWLKYWHTYPLDHVLAFENVRRSVGETRHIIEAPAHVFHFSTSQDYEQRTPTDIESDAMMMNLVLLVMCFDWSAYILARGSNSFVFVDDERVILSAGSQRMEREAKELAATLLP